MKIYDVHSDIFYNLANRSSSDPFYEYHLDDLVKGNIKGGIWVIYQDSDFDVISKYKLALERFKKYEKDFFVIKGLEGMRSVKTLDELKILYDLGIRHGMLTWNEDNHLASGAKGNPERGLTKMGLEFIHFMNEHNMIVDVSHLNEVSFYDVLRLNPKYLIASHSNAYTLCKHVRNLKDEQLYALKEHGGYVGVVACRNFVSSNKEEQNTKMLVKHLRYISNIIGIDYCLLGLDMMNFLDDFDNSNLDDLSSHKDTKNLIMALKEANFSDLEIEKVTHLNFERLIERIKENEKNN